MRRRGAIRIGRFGHSGSAASIEALARSKKNSPLIRIGTPIGTIDSLNTLIEGISWKTGVR